MTHVDKNLIIDTMFLYWNGFGDCGLGFGQFRE